MAEAIKVSYSGRIATITIDNDKKLNALGLEGYYALAQAMREIALRDDIYITILTGKGRYFSAGADVSVGRDMPPGTDLHPKILIAALNGPALGLSAALTAFADFVYAAPHTFLLTPFSSIGLVAEGGASHAFVQRPKRARGEFAGVLPGQTRKWRQFYGLTFDWVLQEAVGAGLVEIFETRSVGRGVRAVG
ncbi:hypothetical protein NUW58_g6065 [Xylaria curta]|uniref:Uncharacterized protein n=1 Tax=Xylaria curta TaxID=42375 RepID=A0ACC1P0S9_9PEZI|nr:hypothetical protein NUW58_g6065 [Xylaria curta]